MVQDYTGEECELWWYGLTSWMPLSFKWSLWVVPGSVWKKYKQKWPQVELPSMLIWPMLCCRNSGLGSFGYTKVLCTLSVDTKMYHSISKKKRTYLINLGWCGADLPAMLGLQSIQVLIQYFQMWVPNKTDVHRSDRWRGRKKRVLYSALGNSYLKSICLFVNSRASKSLY